MSKKINHPKLPADFKKKWVEALRSGEYKQGSNRLYSYYDNSYCCLGVACRIAGYSEEDVRYDTIVPAHKFPLVPACLHGDTAHGTIVKTLANMNDGWKKPLKPEDSQEQVKPRTFKQIAAFIERYL